MAKLTFLVLLFTATQAFASDWIYHSSQGDVHRFVLTEPTEKGGNLLLVVDVPTQGLQKVVFRKSFRLFEFKSFQDKFDFYNDPKNILNDDSNDTFTSTELGKPLWVPNRSWTEQEELDYAKWVNTADITNLLVGSGVDVDCAKFAVVVRWVYARNHLLPVANALVGSGKLFGHFSGNAAWDKLAVNDDWKKDERFKAGLKYVLSNIYTHSIADDLYPIELSKKYVTPGSIILILRTTDGHTQVVKNVAQDSAGCDANCLTVYWGNEPSSSVVETSPLMVNNFAAQEKRGGFTRWRWPEQTHGVWSLRKSEDMPGFSLLQFSNPTLEDDGYEDWFFDQMGLQRSEAIKAMSRIEIFNETLNFRTYVVSIGLIDCHYSYCDPTGPVYDHLSTPVRDKRLKAIQEQFIEHYNNAPKDDPVLTKAIDKERKQRVYEWSSLNMGDFLFNVDNVLDRMSSDPTVSITERWGMKNVSSADLFYLEQESIDDAWYVRQYQINLAQEKCIAHSCDANDPDVKALSTEMLDNGIRKIRNEMFAMPVNFEPLIANMKDLLSKNLTALTLCPWNKKDVGKCNSYDIFYLEKDWVDKMTSDPKDPLVKRYGAF